MAIPLTTPCNKGLLLFQLLTLDAHSDVDGCATIPCQLPMLYACSCCYFGSVLNVLHCCCMHVLQICLHSAIAFCNVMLHLLLCMQLLFWPGGWHLCCSPSLGQFALVNGQSWDRHEKAWFMPHENDANAISRTRQGTHRQALESRTKRTLVAAANFEEAP